MIILLSPAKTLDFTSEIPDINSTLPVLLKKASVLMKKLKSINKTELQQLMGISQQLSELNIIRNATWTKEHTDSNARPSLFAYKGDVYEGLQAYSFTKSQIEFSQKYLFILSGLYGILSPSDLIMPHRLEMGIPLTTVKAKNLYQYWTEDITNHLKTVIHQNKVSVLINLASQEYFRAIDIKQLGLRVITPEFREFKNGKLQMVSFFTKKARGMMARFIIEHQLVNPEGIKHFQTDGYNYLDNESSENRWFFAR